MRIADVDRRIPGTRFLDCRGMKYGRLTISDEMPTREGGATWYTATCECGEDVKARSNLIRTGKIRSCGCLNRDAVSPSIVGKRYGRLVVAERTKRRKWSKTVWRCVCDCGGETFAVTSLLNNGGVSSCGCLYNERIVTDPGGSAFNSVINSYTKGAKRRKLEWRLSRQEAYETMMKNCHYCDAPPSRKHKSRGSVVTYNGIDRVDNNIGYTPENSVPCCTECNMAKGTMSVGDFLNLVVRIYNHQARKAK